MPAPRPGLMDSADRLGGIFCFHFLPKERTTFPRMSHTLPTNRLGWKVLPQSKKTLPLTSCPLWDVKGPNLAL